MSPLPHPPQIPHQLSRPAPFHPTHLTPPNPSPPNPNPPQPPPHSALPQPHPTPPHPPPSPLHLTQSLRISFDSSHIRSIPSSPSHPSYPAACHSVTPPSVSFLSALLTPCTLTIPSRFFSPYRRLIQHHTIRVHNTPSLPIPHHPILTTSRSRTSHPTSPLLCHPTLSATVPY